MEGGDRRVGPEVNLAPLLRYSIRDLGRAGIPVVRDSGFAFDVEDPTDEQMQGIDRAVAVFKRGAPVVFVNGLAMSNRSVEQTIAAYRGSGERR